MSIKQQGGKLVTLPRPTDAIGATLRHAFATPALPDEMVALLNRLDRRASRR